MKRCISLCSMLLLVTTLSINTVHAFDFRDVTIVHRESWKACAGGTDVENLQFNVSYYDNDAVGIVLTARSPLSYTKEYSIGTVMFDENYYTLSYDESFTIGSYSHNTLTTIRNYINDMTECEFVKVYSDCTVPTGTSFTILFTKLENATGSPAITAFGHELAINTEGISEESNHVVELQNQITALQTDLNEKSQTISELQNTVTQLQQELAIKEQLLQDRTNIKASKSADLNDDGVVNVRDLLTLKKLLMSSPIVPSPTSKEDPFAQSRDIDALTVY